MSADRPQRSIELNKLTVNRQGGAPVANAMNQKPDVPTTLAACRDLAAELLSKSLSNMLDKIEESLFELADKALDRDSQNLYLQARGESQTKRAEIEQEFRRRFVEGFERAVHPEPEQESHSDDLDEMELSLVAHDDYEEDMAVTNIASKLRNKLGDDLNALNQRMGHLLARPGAEGDQNPMGPQAIVEAFRSACQKIESDLNVRLLVLKQFEQVASENVPDVYQNLNRFLIERNILPILPKSGYRRGGAAKRRAPPAPGQEQPGAGQVGGGDEGGGHDAGGYGAQMGYGTGGFAPSGVGGTAGGVDLPAYAVDNQQELLATLQQLLALNQTVQALPSTPPAPGVRYEPNMAVPPVNLPISAYTSVGQSFLDALNRLQQGRVEGALTDVGELDPRALLNGSSNVLRQIKTTSLAESLGHVDAMTIDIVAMLFDYIFDDSNIPGPMKALIGRLQIPVLKVAMLDSRFFARKNHPTRRLLDSLAQAALGWNEADGLDDRLYKKLAELVEGIVDGFDENIEIFTTALTDLEAFMAEEEERADSRAEEAAAQLIAAERAEMAAARAQQLVTQRVDAHADTPELIKTFLLQQWQAVLAHEAECFEEDKAPLQDAIQAMDDLIWSVTPKIGVEERLRLVNMLPKLLKRLETGTERAGLDRALRESFFAELVNCHAAAIKSGIRLAAEQAAAAAQAAATPTAAASKPAVAPLPVNNAAHAAPVPAVPAQAAAPAATAPAAPAGSSSGLDDLPSLDMSSIGSVFEVTDMNWDAGLEKYRDYDDVVANQLKRGAWVDFTQADGSATRMKLAWVSPMKSRYLFTNRQGQNSMEFNLIDLIELFKNGKAQLIESGPSVERAVSDMIDMLQPAAA